MSNETYLDILEVDNLMMTLPIDPMRAFIREMGPASYKEWVDFMMLKFLCLEYHLTPEQIRPESLALDNQEKMKGKLVAYLKASYGLDQAQLEQIRIVDSLITYGVETFFPELMDPTEMFKDSTILIGGRRMTYTQALHFLNDAKVPEEVVE